MSVNLRKPVRLVKSARLIDEQTARRSARPGRVSLVKRPAV